MYVEQQHGFLSKPNLSFATSKVYTLKNLINVILGIGLVLLSSTIIIEQTSFFATWLHISPFIISLLVLSLGTNIPELSLLFRSNTAENKAVIFGDYIGSATANALFMGIFTLLGGDVSFVSKNFTLTAIVCASGLGLFYFLARSDRKISQKEAFFLLGVYILFIIIQILR